MVIQKTRRTARQVPFRGSELGEWGSAGRVLVAPATRPKPRSVRKPERSPGVMMPWVRHLCASSNAVQCITGGVR
jgi:hypothetical protein